MQVFKFNDKEYKYFTHIFNDTRHNERAVEVAVTLDLLRTKKEAKVLEIGSVMPNYFNFKHDVVDKYDESGDPEIIRCDIVDYSPKKKYDLIISISTFEHIGWDSGLEAKEKGTGKIATALEHTKTLLDAGGLMMITMPLGYNTELDQLLKDRKLAFDEIYCMRRGEYNEWEQIDIEAALRQDYRREPCLVGCYVGKKEQANIVLAYTTYLVIGYVHGKPVPKNYSVSLESSFSAGASA